MPPAENKPQTPEEKIAKTTARQAIVIAVIGAIVSIYTVSMNLIDPKASKSTVGERIDKEVSNVVGETLRPAKDSQNGIIADILPVGTVITSTLNFEQFTDLMSLPSPSSFKASDKLCKWAPCDGRELMGSKYARITSKRNAIDLRGVFLRGLNKFDIFESEPVTSLRRDPEDNRTVASFQSDSLKNHSHEYTIYKLKRAKTGGSRNNIWSDDRTTTTTPYGGEETRPKNVAIYYYLKIN